MNEPILELDGVTFRYEAMAMRFDLAVNAGEILGLIGPSGAGKSSLLALIGGFERPESGSIRFNGADITANSPAHRPVDSVFQEHNLFAHLNVATNAGLGLKANGRFDAADKEKIRTALARVGLKGFEKRLPGELSGGERQRVAIARSLLRAKPLLLLDEPFAALGPALRRDMLDLVRGIRDEHGTTVLLVTHQPEDARYVAERIAFVDCGRIAAIGPATELLARTDLPELSLYLGNWERTAPSSRLN